MHCPYHWAQQLNVDHYSIFVWFNKSLMTPRKATSTTNADFWLTVHLGIDFMFLQNDWDCEEVEGFIVIPNHVHLKT